MQLLRRMLIANHVATDMRPIPLGLTPRPYTRLVLAIPGPHAQTLDAALLAPWPEARLWASWRIGFGRQIVGAVLAVGAAGPDPLAMLRARGWRAIAAKPLLRQLATAAIPATLPIGWSSSFAPAILLPNAGNAITTPDSSPSEQHQADCIPFAVGGNTQRVIAPALITKAIATLSQIETGFPIDSGQPIRGTVESDVCATSTADAAYQPAPQCIDWPAGPDTMPPERLGHLLTSLVQSPALTDGRPGRVGLAIPRLKQVLGLTKPEATMLLNWLDHANILEPPANPQQPWRQPRPLATTNLIEIAGRLHATPIPTEIDARGIHISEDVAPRRVA